MPFLGEVTSLHRLLPLLLLGTGCAKLLAEDAPAPPAEAEGESEERAPQAAPANAPEPPPAPGAEMRGAARYVVPFAWETSPAEPLARARRFMAEVLSANDVHAGRGREHFAALADGERPRATVLACADSRVQASAWDASPENDGYTVRNLGNQLATSLGSVQYGVEQLHTPVLLVIGHTRCDAVRAVTSEGPRSPGALGEELSHLKLAERRRGGDSAQWDPLTLAVVANVDAQVAEAVAQFSPRVQSGELTVVGAVYDLAGDLGGGHGRLRIVNVNGNVEDERVRAFVEAIQASEASGAAPSSSPSQARGRSAFAGPGRSAPGGPRATVNAVSVIGSGGFDAVAGGSLRPRRAPGERVPGTVDLTRAPSANRYANIGRSAPSPSAPAPGEAGHASTSAVAPSATRARDDGAHAEATR